MAQRRCPLSQARPPKAKSVHDFERVEGFDQRENQGWDYARCKCPECNGYIHVAKKAFADHIYNTMKRAKE